MDSMKAVMLVGGLVLVAVGVSWSPTLPQSGVRAVMGAPLIQVRKLAEAGNYGEAMTHLDRVQATPNKTSDEVAVIGLMRNYVLAKVWMPPEAQHR
jgi:hypothetical protein